MKTVITAKDAPQAIGPYSQAIDTGTLLFTSGQLPTNPKTGAMPQGIEAQTRQSLENLRTVLAAAGTRMENVVKTTVFLKNMQDFSQMNQVYAAYFPQDGCPARSAVEVSRLPKDALVEIEAVAVK